MKSEEDSLRRATVAGPCALMSSAVDAAFLQRQLQVLRDSSLLSYA
jgi:hypothetical protein